MNTLTQEVLRLYTSKPSSAIIMSGVGSTAETLLRNKRVRNDYDISTIVTDNPKSRASDIAQANGLNLVTLPSWRFNNQGERAEYFKRLGGMLGDIGIQALLYGGFMKIATPDFCNQFPGVNCHPADLSITGPDGIPLYRGMNAVGDMRRGEGCVRATVVVVDCPVDAGSALAISESVYPLVGETDFDLHARLKVEEQRIYPATLALLSEGSIDVFSAPVAIPLGGYQS